MQKLNKKTATRRDELDSPGRQWWRQDGVMLVRLALVVGLVVAGFIYLARQQTSSTVTGTTSCVSRPSWAGPGGTPDASSVHTIEQAYNCILDRYPTSLASQRLLQHAMIGIVNYLRQQLQDLRNAILPAFTGDRQADWQAFQQTYTSMLAHASLDQRQLVTAAVAEMINSLHDNHAHYLPPQEPGQAESTAENGLGIVLPFDSDQFASATPPLYILDVAPGSPAQQAGLRPGDIIARVNDLPPFIDQRPVVEVIQHLFAPTPIQLQIQRPGTTGNQDTKSIHLIPASYPSSPVVSSRMLPGNILFVRLTRFVRGAVDQISRAVQQAGGTHLKGVILDMRSNGGGDVEEQRRIVSLFVHNRTIASFVDQYGQRTDQRTDDSVPLLHLPLVGLINQSCASACDATSAAIHDLHLGQLVGERTAGVVSGPSTAFFLDDGSAIIIPTTFMQGAAGEIVDGIGVPPDYEVRPTLADLAAGRDPVLEKAVQLLQ